MNRFTGSLFFYRLIYLFYVTVLLVNPTYADLEEQISLSTATVEVPLREDVLYLSDYDPEKLTDLLTHPLDLNKVTSTDLLFLPGLDFTTAENIVVYRQQNGPYTKTSQLLQVSGISKEIYNSIKPYLAVEAVPSYPRILFRTRVKIEKPDKDVYFLSNPEFQNPEYLYNFTRVEVNPKINFGYILRRSMGEQELGVDTVGGLSLSLNNSIKYFLTKYWIELRDTLVYDKLVLGTYTLQYDQGLVFYPLSLLYQPIYPQSRGIIPDRGTNDNTGLTGMAMEKRIGSNELSLFFSYKYYTAELDELGKVKTDIEKLKDNYGYIGNPVDLTKFRSLRELLLGGRGKFTFFPATQLSLTGYINEFTPSINPPIRDETDKYLFRGNRNFVYDTCITAGWGITDLVLNYAASYSDTGQYSQAWIVQPTLNFKYLKFYLNVHSYGIMFYSLHGSPRNREIDNPRGEEAILFGTDLRIKKIKLLSEVGTYRYPIPVWQGPIFGRYYGTLTPSYVPSLYFTIESDFLPGWNLRVTDRTLREKKVYKLVTENDFILTEVPVYQGQYRVDVTWKKSNVSLWLRYEYKQYQQTVPRQDEPPMWYNRNEIYEGNTIFIDGKYRFLPSLNLNWRVTFFSGPEENVYLSAVEPLWYNTYLSRLYIPQGSGVRYYFVLNHKLTDNLRVWFKYENTQYPDEFGIFQPVDSTELDRLVRNPVHVFKLQTDLVW